MGEAKGSNNEILFAGIIYLLSNCLFRADLYEFFRSAVFSDAAVNSALVDYPYMSQRRSVVVATECVDN